MHVTKAEIMLVSISFYSMNFYTCRFLYSCQYMILYVDNFKKKDPIP
jgi:hypothetical protein